MTVTGYKIAEDIPAELNGFHLSPNFVSDTALHLDSLAPVHIQVHVQGWRQEADSDVQRPQNGLLTDRAIDSREIAEVYWRDTTNLPAP